MKIPWDLEKNIIQLKPEKVIPKTPRSLKGKLNSMCKYFRNKKVHICYQYSDSYSHPDAHEAYTLYDNFEIEGDCGWFIKFKRGNKIVFEQLFEPDWEFQGLGQLHLYGFGAGSHFSIKLA